MRCNQTTHFGILNGHDTIYLYKFDSNQPLRIASHTGKRIPAHATAIGKALLSGLSKTELDELYKNYKLEAMTEHTITSLEELEKQIEEVRKHKQPMSQKNLRHMSAASLFPSAIAQEM